MLKGFPSVPPLFRRLFPYSKCVHAALAALSKCYWTVVSKASGHNVTITLWWHGVIAMHVLVSCCSGMRKRCMLRLTVPLNTAPPEGGGA